jgi:hypothetical protein
MLLLVQIRQGAPPAQMDRHHPPLMERCCRGRMWRLPASTAPMVDQVVEVMREETKKECAQTDRPMPASSQSSVPSSS